MQLWIRGIVRRGVCLGKIPKRLDLGDRAIQSCGIQQFIAKAHLSRYSTTSPSPLHKNLVSTESESEYNDTVLVTDKSLDLGVNKNDLQSRSEGEMGKVRRIGKKSRKTKISHELIDSPTWFMSVGQPKWIQNDPKGDSNEKSYLSFETGNFKSSWTRSVAALNARYIRYGDQQLSKTSTSKRNFDQKIPSAANQPESVSQELWPKVMIYILDQTPEKALEFLLVTHKRFILPYSMVSDVINHLITRADFLNESISQFQKIADALIILSHRPDQQSLRVDGSRMYILLNSISLPSAFHLVKTLRLNKTLVTGSSLLHLINRLAEAGLVQEAFEELGNVARQKKYVKNSAFQSVCTTLLLHASKDKKGLRLCLKIIPLLSSANIPINVQLCNMMILNAINAGDLKMAYQMYNTLLETDSKPDEFTIATLLKGSTLIMDDKHKILDMIDVTVRSKTLLTSKIVACRLLQTLYNFHIKSRNPLAYNLIVEVYAQFFDIRPLQLLDLDVVTHRRQNSTIHAAAAQPLDIVIRAYLRLKVPSPQDAVRLYNKIESMALEGQEPFQQMLGEDYLPNAFIMYLSQQADSLNLALDLLRDMINNDNHKDSVLKCKPTILTLTILLEAFCKHSSSTNGFLNHATSLLDLIEAKINEEGLSVDARPYMALLTIYSQNNHVKGLKRCIEALRGKEVWDEYKGSQFVRKLSFLENNQQ